VAWPPPISIDLPSRSSIDASFHRTDPKDASSDFDSTRVENLADRYDTTIERRTE
jgi:hypothetical protein